MTTSCAFLACFEAQEKEIVTSSQEKKPVEQSSPLKKRKKITRGKYLDDSDSDEGEIAQTTPVVTKSPIGKGLKVKASKSQVEVAATLGHLQQEAQVASAQSKGKSSANTKATPPKRGRRGAKEVEEITEAPSDQSTPPPSGRERRLRGVELSKSAAKEKDTITKAYLDSIKRKRGNAPESKADDANEKDEGRSTRGSKRPKKETAPAPASRAKRGKRDKEPAVHVEPSPKRASPASIAKRGKRGKEETSLVGRNKRDPAKKVPPAPAPTAKRGKITAGAALEETQKDEVTKKRTPPAPTSKRGRRTVEAASDATAKEEDVPSKKKAKRGMATPPSKSEMETDTPTSESARARGERASNGKSDITPTRDTARRKSKGDRDGSNAVLLLTGIADTAALENKLKVLGAQAPKITDDPKKATHLVVAVDPEKKIVKRSIKLMTGLSTVSHFVDESWVMESAKQKMLLDESQFLPDDKAGEKKHKFKWEILQSKTKESRQSLFRDKHFVILTLPERLKEKGVPPSDKLREIVELAGGTCAVKPLKKKCGEGVKPKSDTIVICDPAVEREEPKYAIYREIVTSEFANEDINVHHPHLIMNAVIQQRVQCDSCRLQISAPPTKSKRKRK